MEIILKKTRKMKQKKEKEIMKDNLIFGEMAEEEGKGGG